MSTLVLIIEIWYYIYISILAFYRKKDYIGVKMVWFKLTGIGKGVILMTNMKSLEEIREKGMYIYKDYFKCAKQTNSTFIF